jgi:hypothetical protein
MQDLLAHVLSFDAFPVYDDYDAVNISTELYPLPGLQ